MTLYDLMDYIPPGSSAHGILQARTLDWVAVPFSMGSIWPRDQTLISCVAGRFLTIWATREAHIPVFHHLNPSLSPSFLLTLAVLKFWICGSIYIYLRFHQIPMFLWINFQLPRMPFMPHSQPPFAWVTLFASSSVLYS